MWFQQSGRSILGLLMVTTFFVAINAIGAGIFYVVFKFGLWVVPGLMESPLFVYPLGLLALGATLLIAYWSVRFINRPRPPATRT